MIITTYFWNQGAPCGGTQHDLKRVQVPGYNSQQRRLTEDTHMKGYYKAGWIRERKRERKKGRKKLRNKERRKEGNKVVKLQLIVVVIGIHSTTWCVSESRIHLLTHWLSVWVGSELGSQTNNNRIAILQLIKVWRRVRLRA